MEVTKDVSYLGKDFGQFRKNLIDFTKQYFPNDYTDFNESSPGMMFMEMSAYVGDVLSYYADNNLKESLLEQASERKNIYDLARSLGYKSKNAIPAYTDIDIFQLVPATGSGNLNAPDFNYCLSIKPGMQVKQKDGPAEFRTLDSVDFSFSSSFNPTEVSVYESDDTTKQPVYYLLKKKAQVVSGEVKTATFTFTTPKQYDKIVLDDTNIIDILSCEESDGDNWYQVDYLAQDTIFNQVPNLLENDPDFVQYRSSSPSLLKLRKTSKRFITRLRSDKKIELQFGAGISDNNDEEIIPNPDNVGNGLAGFRKPIDVDIDPSNFLYTRAYGAAPANTTLTVTYTVGGGVKDNVQSSVLTNVEKVEFDDDPNATTSTAMTNFVKSSISTTNENPARGGKSADTLQDIKNNALSNFATQNRLVTKDDYIIRCYSMPAKFGSISKAYIVPDDQLSQNQMEETRIPNPLAMNLYTLGVDNNNNLTTLNDAIKTNLKNYLDYYRILTDAVNILDAFIVNIGIDFEITVNTNYNSNEVLLQCINLLKQFFSIDKWQINQPIIMSEVMNVLGNTAGVQSVVDLDFKNLYDTANKYSGNVYDLESATKQGIIYPPLDPGIFEIKFLNKDIKGRVVNF
jgi:hypothetical protein